MKNIFTSKTIWFGIAQVVFAGVGYFTGWIDNSTVYTLFVTGLGSIGLRLKTSQPIK